MSKTNVLTLSIALSMLILQAVFIDIVTVKGDPDTTIQDIQCSVEKWGTDDPYGTIVETMINDLAAECASQPYYDYYVDYSSGDTFAYGYAYCRSSLSEQDCTTCLAQAQEELLTRCPSSMHAQVTLTDCFMRYDDYPFND